jgi:hypothetical protein
MLDGTDPGIRIVDCVAICNGKLQVSLIRVPKYRETICFILSCGKDPGMIIVVPNAEDPGEYQ